MLCIIDASNCNKFTQRDKNRVQSRISLDFDCNQDRMLFRGRYQFSDRKIKPDTLSSKKTQEDYSEDAS
jgi:hypothetical protein